MLGVRADFLNLAEIPFACEARKTPRLTFRLARWLALRNAVRGRPQQVWIAAYRVVMAFLFLGAVVRHDSFILRAGDSFFALRWLFDPADVVYAQGTGIAQEKLNEAARGVLNAAGRRGLCVEDKSLLEQRLVDLAGAH